MTWLSQILSKNVRGCAILGCSRGLGFGFGGGGSGDRDPLAAGIFAAALGDARLFAPETAQIIKFGAPHRTAAHNLDRADARRVEWEDAVNPFAIGELGQGQVRIDPV